MIHCKFIYLFIYSFICLFIYLFIYVCMYFENENLTRIVHITIVDFVSTAGCNSMWVRFHMKKVCVLSRNSKVVLLKLKVTYN
jgi:hypothetical protein